MKNTLGKNNSIIPRAEKKDYLLQMMVQLLQEVSLLAQRVAAQVNLTVHATEPNFATLHKESTNFVIEFKKLSDVAIQLKAPLEQKIEALKYKGPSHYAEPILASSLQTVMILHLSSEQSMGKRLEEIQAIERRSKDILQQLETGIKALREYFDDIASRLNLLCYMRDCLKKDGSLPGNIMYNSKIPQTVSSPFGVQQLMPKLQKMIPVAPSTAAPHHVVHQDHEYAKAELEKRRALLLQLREQSKRENSNLSN
ncbi:MAG: hypothetical protein JWO53_848 [Chlamydiia bacterium]|nr:hypothetical protein [Chlamydiia bacterium]